MGCKRTIECREWFSDLVQRAVNLNDGSHRVRVEEVLGIGKPLECKKEYEFTLNG